MWIIDWHKRALGLWRELYINQKKNKFWPEIAKTVQAEFFPGETVDRVKIRVRDYVKCTKLYRETKAAEKPTFDSECSIETIENGRQRRTQVLHDITEDTAKDNKALLAAHGYDNSWEVVSSKNKFYEGYMKSSDGKPIIVPMCSSTITVKPREDRLDFEEMQEHFAEFAKRYKPKHVINAYPRHNQRMLEVSIADLHLGKLSWHGDCGENYDYKICRDRFKGIIEDVLSEIENKDFEYIEFVWANDFYNFDGPNEQTTGGTPQDTDVRWQKMVNIGNEMLVWAIDRLLLHAPVKTRYLCSNHDEVLSYMSTLFLSAWYRDNPNVEVDTDAKMRKYIEYGDNMILLTHKLKNGKAGTREIMPVEQREMWGRTRHHEIHAAHLHSEKAYQTISEEGGIITRVLSSPVSTDNYHYREGYVGAVRKAQAFVWDKEDGLRNIINIPVKI